MFLKNSLITIYILFLLSNNTGLAQVTNTTCANAAPFCTGQVMNFPARTTGGNAQAGPNYGCCATQPGPTWYYMQIQNSGPMVIAIAGSFDVDFVCWGPFPALTGNCNSLSANKIVSCGYSASSTETCTINNAIAGQYYFLMITNFSGMAHNITFQQQNANQSGAASTNCGVLCGITATNSGIICTGQTSTLSVITTSAATTYTWYGPNNYSSNTATNAISGLTATATFSLKGTINSTVNNVAYTNTCQALTTISVIPTPTIVVSPASGTAVCQGGSVNASVTIGNGSGTGPFTYSWFPSSGAGVASPGNQSTLISPLLLASNVTVSTIVYSVTVSPSAAVCPVTETLAITVNNPSNPTLNLPPPLCNTLTLSNLIAAPIGGTWSAVPGLSINGAFTPSLASIGNNLVSYSIIINNCMVSKTGTVSVSQYNSTGITALPNTLCSNDPGFNLMSIVQTTVGGNWTGQAVNNNTFMTLGLPTGQYALTYSTQSTPIASVCPSTSIYTLSVYKPITPTITPINPVCNNSNTVNLVANPSGGLWVGTGISGSGIQFPGLNQIGINTLTYSAGQGTCTASGIATFEVSQFVSAALTSTFLNVCALQGSVNLMSRPQNTATGKWQGPYVNNNYFVPPILPSASYVVTYTTASTPNATLCTDSSTLMVNVNNPPIPNITAAGPFCSNNPVVQMSVSPTNGTWTATSYLSPNGMLTPSLCITGNNLVQYATGNATCFVLQKAFVNVELFTSATLLNKIPDQCTSGSVFNLSQITANTGGIWSGQGISGSLFNPANAGKGSFVLTYSTASLPKGLCTDHSTISVNVFSLSTPVLNKFGPYCNSNLPVQLSVNSMGGIFWGVNNSGISAEGVFNPAYAVVGANLVSYSISSGPCVAIAQTTIMVEKFVSANLEKQIGNICQNSLPVNLESYALNTGGTWQWNGVANQYFDPKAAQSGTNLVIHRTNSMPTASLCPDTRTLIVTVIPTISVKPQAIISGSCSPVKVLVKLPDVEKGSIEWNFGDGSQNLMGNVQEHTYSKAGTYSISLSFNDESFCQAEYPKPMVVKVNQSPEADFEVPQEIMVAENAQFVNLSTTINSNKYFWNVGNLFSLEEIHPVIKFDKPGSFSVTLTATDIKGCKSVITKTIEVKNDFNIYVPNSFTPNGDGLNDKFFPVISSYGIDSKKYNMEIFDRWGHLLFNTNEINQAWDGIVGNSENEVKQDVYVYKISYADLDGKLYTKTGTLTLLK